MTAIFMVSCEGDLNTQDPTQLPAEAFIVDGETALQALFKAYDDVQDRYVAGAEMKMIQGLYSDELMHPGSFPHLDEALFNNFLPNNAGTTPIFGNHYDIINTTTEVIRLTEVLDDVAIEPAVKQAIIAEAHGLRAYGYFQLVKVFGGLPITEMTVPLDGPGAKDVPRSSEAEVYTYILNEIALAEGGIATTEFGRMTADALRVLKAEVLLFTGDYPGVENTLAPLIGEYALVGEYRDLYREDGPNSESIWRVNYNSTDSNGLSAFFTPTGRREVAPTQSLLDAFEPNDDRLDRIANDDDINTVFIRKWTAPTDQPYIYRYADVLLMYAEALARRNAPNAADFLNEVRERALLDPVTLNSSNVVERIAQERRIEFYGEAKRWEDVKRLGLAPTVISAKGITYREKLLLWPIPQNELDRNSLLNQENQNPGY